MKRYLDKQGNEYCLRLCFGADGYSVVDACWQDILSGGGVDYTEQLSRDVSSTFESMESFGVDGVSRVEFVHFDDLDFVFAYCLASWDKGIVCNDYRCNIDDLSNYSVSDDFVSKYDAADFVDFDYLVVEE